MNVLESLVELDKQLLLFGNNFHSPFWDQVIFIFSGKFIWIPAALTLLYAIIRSERKNAVWILLALVLTVVLSDQISHLIKHWVERPRPTHEPTLAGLVTVVHGYTGGRFGFVSSHACNGFAVALFTSLVFRRKLYTWTIFTWATLNALTRIYLGVHYPLDILCGALLGIMCGAFVFYLLKRWKPQVVLNENDPYIDKSVLLIAFVLVLSLGVMMIGHDYLLFLA